LSSGNQEDASAKQGRWQRGPRPLLDESFYPTFTDNVCRALGLQREELRAGGSAVFGVTPFMHLTPEQFRAHRLLPNAAAPEANHTAAYSSEPWAGARVWALVAPAEVPSEFDWRSAFPPVVSAVNDQGQCGSCWSFSASQTIESARAIRAKQPVVALSAQQGVDCAPQGFGCEGGWPRFVFDYLLEIRPSALAGALATEALYPYRDRDQPCKFSASVANGAARLASWGFATLDRDEKVMASALLVSGPLSVCVQAATWQYYRGGVLSQCGRSSAPIDHCVQLVGFGSSGGGGGDFWSVRNTWGPYWGEQGYIRLARGSNTCMVASMPIAVSA
jgi:cathepsin F/cysteine peptidase B